MDPPKVMTVREAAARLCVSAPTVRTWIAEGRLKAYRLSPRKTLVDAADVERLWSEAQVSPQKK